MLCKSIKPIRRILGGEFPKDTQFSIDFARDRFVMGISSPEISINPYSSGNILCPTKFLRLVSAETPEETQWLLSYIEELKKTPLLFIVDKDEFFFFLQGEEMNVFDTEHFDVWAQRNILSDFVLETAKEENLTVYIMQKDSSGCVKIGPLDEPENTKGFWCFEDALQHFNNYV